MAYFLMITTNFVPLFLIKLIFKIMKLLFSFLVSLPLITNLVGCAGSNDGANLEVPRDIDLDALVVIAYDRITGTRAASHADAVAGDGTDAVHGLFGL